MYRLDLSSKMRISRVRYVSVLDPADPDILLMEDIPDIDSKGQEKIWEVEKILDTDLMNNS